MIIDNLESRGPHSTLSPCRSSMKLGHDGLYDPRHPYLAPLGLGQLLGLSLLELLHHLGLHDLLGLRHPPQHLGLYLLSSPLELLLNSFSNKFLDSFVCFLLDASELIIFDPSINLILKMLTA